MKPANSSSSGRTTSPSPLKLGSSVHGQLMHSLKKFGLSMPSLQVVTKGALDDFMDLQLRQARTRNMIQAHWREKVEWAGRRTNEELTDFVSRFPSAQAYLVASRLQDRIPQRPHHLDVGMKHPKVKAAIYVLLNRSAGKEVRTTN
jgi:hypothetical protein